MNHLGKLYIDNKLIAIFPTEEDAIKNKEFLTKEGNNG